MYILINDLYRELSSAGKILIYGAGNYANIIYPMLKKAGLKEKIYSFIVTNIKDDRKIDGIPVKSVYVLHKLCLEKYKILIAVSKEYEKEIIQFLSQYHYLQVLKLTDYILHDDDLIELYKKQSDEQFIKWILEDYVWNSMSCVSEFEKKGVSAQEIILQRKAVCIDRDTIVFILGNFSARTVKIIDALRRRNFNIVVIGYGEVDDLVSHELNSCHIELLYCKTPMEVMSKALQYHPLIFYCDPKWGDCTIPEIMIRHKGLFGKIVFTTYDVLNDAYVNVSEKQKLSERYALENADGIVWRWFSKEYLQEAKGFVYKGKSIQFLDYCNGYKLENKKKYDRELRLCYLAGGTYGLLDKEIYANDGHYIEMARIDNILKKIGKRNDCIFHVFIGEISKSDREKFDILQNEYSNFRFFGGLQHDELIKRISLYDYGCFLTTGGKDIPNQEADGCGMAGSNYSNAVGNRFFDYIDAGLAVVAERPKKLCEYLDRLGAVVKMNLSNLDIEYLKEKRQSYRENISNAKKILLIDNQIQRLIDFFYEIYE